MFQSKAIILLGPRQTGKTTLVQAVAAATGRPALILSGDVSDVRTLLQDTNAASLRRVFGGHEIIVIDEAQRIRNIGLTLKICVENFKEKQFLATGSSSFELSNEVNEPLTGRKYQFMLFPLAFKELTGHTGFLEERRLLEQRMIYGYYPEVCTNPGREREILAEICESYLYKDIFSLERIRKPAVLEKILQALALQLGSEVSCNELGQMVGADNQTVEHYIDLLEKAFVVFRLGALSRNLRNEIKKSRKVYFYDTGIRNAIIKNFNPLALRNDVGALWENFMILERAKINAYGGRYLNRYFWRTTSQSEVDYIEELGGKLHAFEFKWNERKRAKIPASFLASYPEAEGRIITPANFEGFALGEPDE